MNNKKITAAVCVGAALLSMGIVKVVSTLQSKKQVTEDDELSLEIDEIFEGI